ncbi:MAG: hypothetical protein U1F10_07590 [Burkholderiales bacterium]
MKTLRLAVVALAAGLLAAPAWASFGGNYFTLTPVDKLVVGFLGALPGAILGGVFEYVLFARRPPAWVGALALLLAAASAARFLGLGPRGDAAFFLFPVPPLSVLGLACLVRAPKVRLALVWAVALAGWWAVATIDGHGWPLSLAAFALPTGGAIASLLFWQAAHLLAARRAARAGAAPPTTPG